MTAVLDASTRRRLVELTHEVKSAQDVYAASVAALNGAEQRLAAALEHRSAAANQRWVARRQLLAFIDAHPELEDD